MQLVQILSGDLAPGTWLLGQGAGGGYLLRPEGMRPSPHDQLVPLTLAITSIRVLTTRPRKKLLPTALAGLAGYVLLGPLGAVGGMLVAGSSSEYCFALRFADQRTAIAVADYQVLNRLISCCIIERGNAGPILDLEPVGAGMPA